MNKVGARFKMYMQICPLHFVEWNISSLSYTPPIMSTTPSYNKYVDRKWDDIPISFADCSELICVGTLVTRIVTVRLLQELSWNMACALTRIVLFTTSISVKITRDLKTDHNMIINSSSLSATYMCQWIRSALVQIMACRLFGTKPLSKPMLSYCQLDP